MPELDAAQIRNRLRALIDMRGDRETAARELIDNFLSSPEECAAALRVLGPPALRELERRTLRGFTGGESACTDLSQDVNQTSSVVGADPPVPIDNRGNRKPLLLWTILDIEASLRFLGKVRSALGQRHRDLVSVKERMKGKQTIQDVWSGLPKETRKRLAAFGGVRRLAA